MKTSARMRHHSMFFLLLFFLGLGASTAWAQSTARLAGTIKDPSGASVANATVTLTNQATNVSRTTKTDTDGNYIFSLVEIGKYTLTIEHTGFKKNVQSGIILEVNQNGRLDVTLDLGQTTETVEVTAAVPQVDTSGAVLGKVEDTKRIQDLPLVDRDTLQLGLLQAGVFALDPDDGSGNPFNVSGQRSESLTFLVDGADNTDFLNNNIVVSPNPDAVAEFKILTNNYDAEFGRSSGGIVNQVIKSGTNSVHGAAFEFLRNDFFNAKDYFLAPSDPKASFKRNVFGGTIGAPIKKDKTFIFLSYQGGRRREGQVSPQLTVLSPAERQGDFSELLNPDPAAQFSPCPNPGAGDPVFEGGALLNPATFHTITCANPDQSGNPVNVTSGTAFTNNQVPVNPIIANYIQKYLPLPNQANNGYLFAKTAAIDEDQGILRFDHNLTSRDTLSFAYLLNDVREAFPFIIGKGASSGGNLPDGSAFSDTFRNQVGSLTWTHTFQRGWINEVRVSANRTATLQANPTDHTSPSSFGFTNLNSDDPGGVSIPQLYTSGFNIGPSPQGPTKEHNMVYQEQDHLTIPSGRHEWKFGADVRRVQNNFNYDFYNNGSFDFGLYGNGDFNGTITGNSLADFVGGFPDNFYQSSNAVYGIRTTSQYYYAQDTFKIHPRLTLVLGVRYEYNSPLSDIHNNVLGYFGPTAQSTVFPNAPTGILYPGDPGTPNRALVYPDKNNFAPRVGFAWDIFGNAKLVMRGGFGIFYDIQDGAGNLQYGGQPPFGYIANFNFYSSSFSTADPSNPPNYLADPFALNGSTNPYPYRAGGHVGEFFTPALPYAYVTDPHFRTPYSENFNYGFQYQVAKNTALEMVYVGSLGRKLISTVDANPPQPDVEKQMLANGIPLNIDCSRLLSGCVNPTTDPNASLQAIGQLFTNKSTGLSDSHQLQVTLDQRYDHGISFRAAYTLAKTIDLTSGFRSRSATYTDPFNPRLDRALADFDVHNRFVFSGSWELPIDKPFRNTRFMKKITEGWEANVIASFQGGTPFTLYSNQGQSKQGNQLDRVDLVGKIKTFDPRKVQSFSQASATCLGADATGNFWFDPTAFNCQNIPLFTFGTLGRNTIRGPGINNWDISFNKKTKITEATSVEFRAEMFNAFNHVQFFNPDNAGGSATFGQITTTRGPRLVQFGLKFYY